MVISYKNTTPSEKFRNVIEKLIPLLRNVIEKLIPLLKNVIEKLIPPCTEI